MLNCHNTRKASKADSEADQMVNLRFAVQTLKSI